MELSRYNGKIPLIDYPWHEEIDRLAEWSSKHDSHFRAFSFDIAMSLAYIDATSGIERFIESCSNSPKGFNSHLGFINMCAPSFENEDMWIYQKAAKPQSGALGKLSSEIILRFIKVIYKQFDSILSIGGTESADAVIEHQNGTIILAEVKSAPLLTYPVLFKIEQATGQHKSLNITSSQLKECDSALYLHNNTIIPLGKVKSDLWPFKPTINYITDPANSIKVKSMASTWLKSKEAYKNKDRNERLYFLANASGQPPASEKKKSKWPCRESISDSKTSAGMDRTDDIKKGIYQVLKIGAQHSDNKNMRTALISNLPAYRHGKEYVDPFIDMLWGYDSYTTDLLGQKVIERNKLKRIFDYLITLEEPLLRDLSNESI